jgi:hypothetical protein
VVAPPAARPEPFTSGQPQHGIQFGLGGQLNTMDPNWIPPVAIQLTNPENINNLPN